MLLKRNVLLNVVVFMLFFVSIVGSAWAYNLGDAEFEVTGFLKNETGLRLKDGINSSGDLSQCRNILQVETFGAITEKLKMTVILRGYYEASYSLDSDINQAPKDENGMPDGESMHYDADVREYYVTYLSGGFRIRAGRQQIVWGESDALRMSDIINPLDLSVDGGLGDWEDIRVPLRMINASYTFPGHNEFMVEVVWNPEDFRPNIFAPQGANWSPGLPNIVLDQMEDELEELTDDHDLIFQGGIRIGAKFGEWDIHLFDYYQRAQSAVNTLDFTHAPLPVHFRWPRQNVLGGSFNVYEEHTGTVFRGECAYVMDEAFTKKNPNPIFAGLPDVDYAEKDTFSLMLGFDRPTFFPDLNLRSFFISGQLFYKTILNYKDNLAFTGMGSKSDGEDQFVASLLINTDFWYSRILPQFMVVHDFSGRTGFLKPQIGYNPNSTWLFTLGAYYFWADKPTGSIWGAYENNDEVFFKVKLMY